MAANASRARAAWWSVPYARIVGIMLKLMVYNGKQVAEGVVFALGKIVTCRLDNDKIEVFANESALRAAYPEPVYKIVSEPRG